MPVVLNLELDQEPVFAVLYGESDDSAELLANE